MSEKKSLIVAVKIAVSIHDQSINKIKAGMMVKNAE
jgi:hypothetical protein